VVGIVDTGIDYTHPDLQTNVWSAPADFTVTLNGVPVACPAGSHGFNAVSGSCDPMDDYMHGTHVSGIIGAAGNNSVGVVGVNWTTQMMGLKFLNSQGYGYTSDAVTAIEFGIQVKTLFASTNGADLRILSNSWAGGGFSQALQDEIDRAADNDMLFVAAAGNNGSNIDWLPMYPASYNRPNMIVVAATDNNDALAYFSNFGSVSVHLGAPGVAVLSTLPGNSYGYLSGTSMATPQVSGAAALILSVCGVSTPELKQTLLDNVDSVPSLAGQTVTGGRLNVSRAIRSCNGPVGLSPSLLSFGTVLVGRSSGPLVARLKNYQSSTLNLSGILASGDFSQTNDCGNALAPKAACSISVTFAPNGEGAKSGQLQVLDDAGTSPQISDLTGTGTIAPDLVASISTAVAVTAPGTVIAVNSTILNQGSADAGASLAGIYLSRTGHKDSGTIAMGSFNAPVLPPGNSFTTPASVTIPISLAAGSYYLLACADDTNLVSESNETNNCGASSLSLQIQLPDLIESAVSFLQTAAQTLQVTDTVTNQGITDASASVTRYYLGPFTSRSSNARLLNGSRAVPGLAAGASSQATTAVTVPADMAVGGYYLLACADDTNQVSERTENNNCAASSAKVEVGPDLIESSVSSSTASVGPGMTFAVTDTAVNQGGWRAAASLIQYYLGPFTTKNSSARLLNGSRSVAALTAQASSLGTVNVTVQTDMPAGSYYLLACADDTNLVPEINESNNCAASTTRIQVGPELMESGVSSAIVSTGPGTSFVVSDTTTNQGGGDAGASITQYYLGPFTTKNSSARVLSGNRSVPVLAAGASSQASAIVTVPSNMAVGSYYLLACADDTGLVPETNENNNCAASPARIQVGPDLVESGVSSTSTSIGPGASLVVSDTTTNQGGGDAGASITQYYLGPFSNKSSNARLLMGNRSVPGLSAGVISQGTVVVTVPANMATGSYYLLACADDTGLVPETNENNNCAVSFTKVQVGP
jgi:subtilisin family serine protease/lysozyme family protein